MIRLAVQTVTPEQLRVVGLEPGSLRAIVGKGVNAPRAGYADVCSGVIVVDTPGVTRNSVQELPYRHRRRPMFPFEPEAEPRNRDVSAARPDAEAGDRVVTR